MVPDDSVVFQIEIQGQVWPGYYLGECIFGVKYVPKRAENGKYKTSSELAELDGLAGAYVSTNPWPGRASSDDYKVGGNWYSDRAASGWRSAR